MVEDIDCSLELQERQAEPRPVTAFRTNRVSQVRTFQLLPDPISILFLKAFELPPFFIIIINSIGYTIRIAQFHRWALVKLWR